MEKTKKQIALELLAPYYANPETCGLENGTCSYKTEDGKMCVAGKCFDESVQLTESQKSASILSLLQVFGQERLFKKEFQEVFTGDEWYWMQRIHDSIACNSPFIQWVTSLNLFTLQELKDAGQNHS